VGGLSTIAANAALDHMHGTPYTPPASIFLALSVAFSVVNAGYQWTASGSGTAEYYLEAAGGGDPGLPDPEIMLAGGAELAAGTLGSLSAGEFGFGDNDALGFNTVYVRLADDTDPDSKADGYLMAGGNPGNDGSGLNEPGDTYTRQLVSYSPASSRRATQAITVEYPLSAAAWGWVTHWAVTDAETGGNILASGRFAHASQIEQNLKVKILDESPTWIQINGTSTGAGITDYAANALLNLIFRGASFSIAGLQMALLSETADDTAEQIGADCSEISGTGYSRVSVNPAGGSAPAFSAAAARQVSNADVISWGQPGADDWSQLTAAALVTDAGYVLAYDNNLVAFMPSTSDSIRVAAGEYTNLME